MTPRAIIKIGGSLAADPGLTHWLRAIADLQTPVIVVPGGGPFADVVRAQQSIMGYSDQAAHRMALLAMAQYGQALVSLDDRFIHADFPDDFSEAWLRRRVPIWSPDAMIRERDDIAPSWDITSDSLALWLAAQTGAQKVILIKSVAPQPGETLANHPDIVDAAFTSTLQDWGGEAIWFGPTDWDKLPQCLRKSSS